MDTMVERKSDRELVVKRVVNGPPHLVFEAWTKPDLFKRWWVPKSMGMSITSCEIDARTGGKYHLVFGQDGAVIFEAFGKYLDVTPNSRIVWTNDEGDEAGPVTTASFQEQNGKTLLVISDLFPSKEALDEAIAAEAINWNSETFEQLDELLASQAATVG